MREVTEIVKALGGVEDLLLDATAPSTVEQLRAGSPVEITKINLDTIPAESRITYPDFVSAREYILSLTNPKSYVEATTIDGGFILTVGDSGLTWDGDAPANDQIAMAQRLSNDTYRWIGIATLGSDNWQFRGRVAGDGAVNDNEFVTKAQLDAVKSTAEDGANVQSDFNQTDSSADDFIKNKPTRPSGGDLAMLEAGTDTDLRLWTAKDLHDFSEANGCGTLAGLFFYHDDATTQLPIYETLPAETVALEVSESDLLLSFINNTNSSILVEGFDGHYTAMPSLNSYCIYVNDTKVADCVHITVDSPTPTGGYEVSMGKGDMVTVTTNSIDNQEKIRFSEV